jgi:hypothetical protein
MLGLRFDPALPLVATSAFQAGELKVESGDVFDWRARGLTELDARTMFGSGLLIHPDPAMAETTIAAPPKQKPQQDRREKR